MLIFCLSIAGNAKAVSSIYTFDAKHSDLSTITIDGNLNDAIYDNLTKYTLTMCSEFDSQQASFIYMYTAYDSKDILMSFNINPLVLAQKSLYANNNISYIQFYMKFNITNNSGDKFEYMLMMYNSTSKLLGESIVKLDDNMTLCPVQDISGIYDNAGNTIEILMGYNDTASNHDLILTSGDTVNFNVFTVICDNTTGCNPYEYGNSTLGQYGAIHLDSYSISSTNSSNSNSTGKNSGSNTSKSIPGYSISILIGFSIITTVYIMTRDLKKEKIRKN